jgi:hypothetical protein
MSYLQDKIATRGTLCGVVFADCCEAADTACDEFYNSDGGP